MNEFSTKSELEALQETVKFLENLLRTSVDGFVITDASQNIVMVNEAFCTIFERSRREVIETNMFTWLEMIDYNAVRQWAELEKDVFKKGFCHNMELYKTSKLGVTRYFNVNASRTEQASIYSTSGIISIWRDITERKQAEKERENLITRLKAALSEIKTLKGILPLCSFCKKIRDDKGYWEQVDTYIHKYSEAEISHSVCPECVKKHYPEVYEKIYPDKNIE